MPVRVSQACDRLVNFQFLPQSCERMHTGLCGPYHTAHVIPCLYPQNKGVCNELPSQEPHDDEERAHMFVVDPMNVVTRQITIRYIEAWDASHTGKDAKEIKWF